MAIFEVQYWFNCPEPECLKQTVNMITITADDSASARGLAVAGLSCEHCHKELPNGYSEHITIKQVG
jgi:hypothetical protein